jgi:phytoene dehydrogenase-like protein
MLPIFTHCFPSRLAEGTWDTRRDAIADQVLAELGRYVPTVPGSVLARQVLAPRDLEARFGLTGGISSTGSVPE